MREATKTDHYEILGLRWKETCIFIKTALREPGKLSNDRTYLDKPESSRGILWWCSADGRTQSVRYSTSLFRNFTSWWSNNSSLFAIICHQKQQQTIKYSLLLTALSTVIFHPVISISYHGGFWEKWIHSAKIPTTSISWQSLHFICRAWWLTGRFLTYLKINDMERTMLSHLMCQAHPVRLFLSFSSIKPPRVLFPFSLQDASPSPSYHYSPPPPPTPAHSLPGHHVSYM